MDYRHYAWFDVGICTAVSNCNPDRWLADKGIVAPQDCQGSFTEWTTCDCPTCADDDPERRETRTFNQTRPATNGGQPCEAAHGQVQTRECPRDPFTRWEGSWTEMSQSAGAYTFAEVYQEQKTFRSQSRYLETNNIRASNTDSRNWNVCTGTGEGGIFGISVNACAGREQSTTLEEEQSTAWESIFSQTATALQSRSLQRTWTCDGRTYQYVLKGRTASGREVEVTTEQLTCFKSTSRLYNGRPECATAVTSADRVRFNARMCRPVAQCLCRQAIARLTCKIRTTTTTPTRSTRGPDARARAHATRTWRRTKSAVRTGFTTACTGARNLGRRGATVCRTLGNAGRGRKPSLSEYWATAQPAGCVGKRVGSVTCRASRRPPHRPPRRCRTRRPCWGRSAPGKRSRCTASTCKGLRN